MRILTILVLAIVPAVAQTPSVQLLNMSRPSSSDFQIGDRFEVRITGALNQPVSVRTSMSGRTDWSPVIGKTDITGQWTTSGQFEKRDFGDWREMWTVGGKLASPAIEFSVNAPCVPGGEGLLFMSGPSRHFTCKTAEGTESFVTPSSSDPFRTPDGRLVEGRILQQTPEQYHSQILEYLIGTGMGTDHVALQSAKGGRGDETAELISKLIGVNALSEGEIRNSLAIVRAAFEKPERLAPSIKQPLRTLALLRRLAEIAEQDGIKREIAETMAYFQAR